MIRVRDLTKYYGSKCAVDSVSLDVERGTVYGLLGPNGAGKTTIIKMLTTLSRPTRGSIFFDSIDAVRQSEEIRRLIAVVPQDRNFDAELSVYENMLVYGMLHGVDGLKRKIEESLAALGLSGERNTPAGALSGGTQKRLLIARTLLPGPEVLFMDEPSVGLDPQVRRDIWDIVRDIRAGGRTVFLTTHYMEEAESLCDKVGILSKGRLVIVDTPANLKESVGRYVVETGLPDGKRNRAICMSRQDAVAIAEAAGNGAVIRPSNLEDVFIKVTGEVIEQ
ncbi:MAG: ABC transporter ATP-binding protein [Alphaproteobacteria bacterium]|uniref:ABC transporter ATP-binding protein n=1 Tax=Candidatus Nitrobium versatile TaxID=2884831 RepID=A0A953SG15_9BACT|nr:ABC transporter ATP-binding protein [Candidatus Nitrobium versatile]